MNYFAKYEKLLRHSTSRIIITSFMTVRSQMPGLDGGGGFFALPPYKLGSQYMSYKLRAKDCHKLNARVRPGAFCPPLPILTAVCSQNTPI